MSIFSYYRVELARLLQSKMTRLAALFCVLSAAAPLLLHITYESSTRFMNFIGVCNHWGCIAGGIIFAMLSIYELSNMYRCHADSIIDTIASPPKLYLARTLALLTVGTAAGILVMLCLLPYGLLTMSDIFDSLFYIQSFLLFTTCSINLSILFAAALYAISRKVSVSVLVFLAAGYVGNLSRQFYYEPLFKWLMPNFSTLSDDFGNHAIIKVYLYSRFIWFMLFGGLYFLSCFCLRRYGKGLLGSLRANLCGRRLWFVLPAIAMLLGGGAAYVMQPLYDHSPPLRSDVAYTDDAGEGTDERQTEGTGGDGFSFVYSDEEETVTDLLLLHSTFDADIDAGHGSLRGNVIHTVINRSETAISASLYINPGYTVAHIRIDGTDVRFEDLRNDFDGRKEIRFVIPASESEQAIEIAYGGACKMWNLLKGTLEGSNGIYNRYISLGGRDLYPRFDVNIAEDVRSQGTITMPERFVLAATGASNAVVDESSGKRTWSVDVNSDSVTFEAAEYECRLIRAGGLEIEFFFHRKHTEIMEELGAVELMADVVNYFTQLLGPLPYDNDVPLKIIQCTGLGGSGYATGNISVMSEMSFSIENLNDLDKGASSQEVLVHEIIHQWWGISAMCYDTEETWWTNEGITVYCTWLYVSERYGEEYANTHYLKHWEDQTANMMVNFYYRYPVWQEVLSEAYRSVLESGFSSTQLYAMSPLVIYNAAQIVGTDNIKAAMAELYQNGGAYLPPFITFQDFLDGVGLKKEDISIV